MYYVVLLHNRIQCGYGELIGDFPIHGMGAIAWGLQGSIDTVLSTITIFMYRACGLLAVRPYTRTPP